MRLNEQEKTAIREVIHGEDPTADIYLFGSRLDDARHGGDIDLYVETAIHEKLLKHKARILSKLWERIGVQRIDIILRTRSAPLKAIHRMAKKTGIQL
jgi:predicted nucleotidyltransferase